MHTVTIVYPTDPLGVVPGGTDTCIRDILRCAPDDIRMQLVGVTTDPAARPVGEWVTCTVSGKPFEFYGLMEVTDLESQMRIPLSLQFTLRLFGKPSIFNNTDVIQLNRIEPAISLLGLKKPKLLIIHQNMNVISNKNSDIRWKYLPGLYFKIEEFLIKRIREVFIVREDAVAEYQNRFPDKKDSIHFLPTWMNPSLFYYLEDSHKQTAREQLGSLPSGIKLLVFVGRLDHQKDPLYLIEILASLKARRDDWKMLMIGDGVLREEVEQAIVRHNLENNVVLLGARLQDQVAEYLRASDMLLLSSVYEGMPRCVVEALGCGVPVVTTKAGEVTLLINEGRNGFIVEERNAEAFSDKIVSVLDNLDSFKGGPCLSAVEPYRAETVLGKLYSAYRDLAGSN